MLRVNSGRDPVLMSVPYPCAHGALLLVEDDPDAAGLDITHFRHHGYDVEHVTTAETALRVAEARHFDLVVLDLLLPGTSGADLIDLLRQCSGTSGTPVVVSSVLDRREYPDGIAGALPKPFSRADVARLVESLATVGE